MNFRYKKVFTIKSSKSQLDINRIMTNLKINIEEIDAVSESSDDTLYFKRKVKRYLKTGDSRLHYLKIIRKGNFKLLNITQNSIDLVCEVDLDTLLFLSAILGLMFGYLSYVFICRNLTVIFIGFITWLIIFLTGYLLISIKMNSIIENSCG